MKNTNSDQTLQESGEKMYGFIFFSPLSLIIILAVEEHLFKFTRNLAEQKAYKKT